MDKSAIEKIQEMAVQAAHTDSIGVTDTLLATLHKDFALHNLEPYMSGRARFRGAFTTNMSSEFVSYFTQNHDEHTRIFINEDKLSAVAIFNIGDAEHPGHCDHVARLTLKKTREFQAIIGLDSRIDLSQREMADWIEDWRDHITAHDNNGEEIELKRVIAAIRNVEINASLTSEHSDGDFSAKKSTLEKIEAKSRHGLPNTILFHCHPYQELNTRDIPVRLRVATSNDAPRLSARIIGIEALMVSLQREFVSHLINLLNETETRIGQTILIGEFDPGK
jgi:uncharacterized protein YfdQ (DUF2303 family)